MQPDFCIDFLNRKCQLTKRTCRNIHVSYEHREVLKKVCIKFLNGKCDSKNCFEHKTLKQLKIPTPDTYYANAEIEDYTDARFCRNWVLYHKCKPNCTDVHPINKDILVMRKCCLDFLLDGHCTTPSCPKPHKAYADIDIWPPSAYPNKYPKTEICIDWLNGKCKDSDADCKWIHVEKNHIKILTKNSNHEEKMSSNAFFTKMLRLHVGCSIREYEYKFPPVSPMVEDPHKSSALPTNGTTPVPKEAVAATSPSPSQQQPSAKVATKDQKSIQPGQKETSSPPLMHHQPHSLPQPNGKSVNGHVSPKENHIAAQPAIVSPVVPPASAEPTMPIDQVLLKIISTCMEMRQLWLSEHEHKANAEAELETLKHALTEQATIVRNEEERLVKYFFDSLMGEEYLRHASEAVPETQSILLGPLKEAAALIEKYKRTAPVVANKYIAHPVTDLISKNRAETLVQNLRAFMRQFNIDGFPQAVQDVASNRGDVESQIGVVEKTLEDLQSQKTAIRQKYQFLNTKEPLQCLNLSELEMLETHIKNESEQILSTIATSIYCIVCKVNLRIIAVLPCGHLYYCEECANKIGECASCGTPIQYRAYIKR